MNGTATQARVEVAHTVQDYNSLGGVSMFLAAGT
jgi:hypothetical protein